MIEKRAENIMIPEEANYQRTMKRDVEPYLRSYEKDGYIEKRCKCGQTKESLHQYRA